MTSITGVSMDAVARSSYVPTFSSFSGFRSFCVSLTFTAMNFNIRYWVMTLTTIVLRVSSSLSTIGMRRARDSSILRHASYTGRSGCMEIVSMGLTPRAFSISVRVSWWSVWKQSTYLSGCLGGTDLPAPKRLGSASSIV